MNRSGATTHPAETFKSVCREVLSANRGKGTKQNTSKCASAHGQVEAFLRQPGGGEKSDCMIAVMSYTSNQCIGELIVLPVRASKQLLKVFLVLLRVVLSFH